MKIETLIPSADQVQSSENNSVSKAQNGSAQAATLVDRALRQFLLEIVALIYDVKLSQLVSPTRGRKNIAFARQVAMYLAHTGGGLSLSAVGRLFERDRTTVAHACALVEDGRDDPLFDRTLGHIESAMACQMNMFARSMRSEPAKPVARREHQL